MFSIKLMRRIPSREKERGTKIKGLAKSPGLFKKIGTTSPKRRSPSKIKTEAREEDEYYDNMFEFLEYFTY